MDLDFKELIVCAVGICLLTLILIGGIVLEKKVDADSIQARLEVCSGLEVNDRIRCVKETK